MTKAELVDAVAASASLNKTQASAAVNAVFEAISGNLQKGNNVTLIGFGTFKVLERQARTGRNPRTGEEIKIAARKSVSFSAGKSLKESVNN